MPKDHTMEMSIPDLSQDGMGEWSMLCGREWNVEEERKEGQSRLTGHGPCSKCSVCYGSWQQEGIRVD